MLIQNIKLMNLTEKMFQNNEGNSLPHTPPCYWRMGCGVGCRCDAGFPSKNYVDTRFPASFLGATKLVKSPWGSVNRLHFFTLKSLFPVSSLLTRRSEPKKNFVQIIRKPLWWAPHSKARAKKFLTFAVQNCFKSPKSLFLRKTSFHSELHIEKPLFRVFSGLCLASSDFAVRAFDYFWSEPWNLVLFVVFL